MTQKKELSKDAKRRLRWFEFNKVHGNARLTCRHFGISPDTFYLWKRRYDPKKPQTLEDDTRNRRPHTFRKPIYDFNLVIEIAQLHALYEKAGPLRITGFLRQQGKTVSVATVGRILRNLKKVS